jgi:hypothetical protein
VLDDQVYSDLEYESAMDGIRQQIQCADTDRDSLPIDLPNRVYSWLDDNEPGELENVDDRGAWPCEESVERAMLAVVV